MTAVVEPPVEICENPAAPEKPIQLDLGDQRRHSFLPESWAEEKRDTIIKNIGIVEFNEDDDLFMYMQASHIYQERPMEKFCTGSKYLGQWNRLGIAGKGVYKYPHGAIYDGYFNRNGEFHGTGILVYPNGYRVEGTWRNGKLGPDCNFITEAGVVMSKNYCLMPDRRFQMEAETDFNPVGQEYLTDETPPPRDIPDDCYDLVEGFYDPNIKCVIDYNREEARKRRESITPATAQKVSTRFIFSGDERRYSAFTEVSKTSESEKCLKTLMCRKSSEEQKVISWIPSIPQEDWITKNCRKAWDEPIGYRPDLYEKWTKGDRAFPEETEEEVNSDSKCKLRTLNLHKDQVPTTKK